MDESSSVQQDSFQLALQPVQSEESKPFSHQWPKVLWVLFVFSIIGAFIGLGFFFWHQASLNNQDPLPCLSSACLRVAERFSSVTDPFSRPCDYYLFSCGTETSYPSRGRHRGRVVSRDSSRRYEARPAERTDRDDPPDRLPDRLTALLRGMKEILESPMRNISNSSAKQKAQTFYRTCLDSDSERTDSAERFLTLIQQLGGWPVSPNWNQSDFNSTLALLMARYNTFPFFSVYVGPDQTGSQRYIQIDQPDFQFPIDWNSQTLRSKINLQSVRPFFSFCRQLLTLLNVSSSSTIQHCGLHVSLSSTLVTNTSTLQHRLHQNHLYQRVTVQELEVLAPSIDWLGCFQALFHPNPVSRSDVVLLQNRQYIVHMSRTITEWKRKYETICSYPLHTYMMLTLLQTLIPVMDSSFIQTMKNFSVAIDSENEEVSHWRHCVLQTVKGFDTLFHHLLKEEYETEQAEEMLRDIYSSFRTKLTSLKWRDKQTEDFVLNKVTFLTPRLSTHDQFLGQMRLDEHYAEVEMSEEDFFSNYLQLLVLQQRWRNRLFSPDPQPDVLSISPFISSNYLIIPVGMFVSPMFHSSYPRAVNYAMLGTLIAKDLLHLLLPDILSQSESPKLESACAWSHYLRATDGSSSLSLSQQQELWVHYSALQISLHSYNESLQRDSRDTSVSGLSHLHLFITSFTQASCSFDSESTLMPFRPSFLVTVLCSSAALCPKPLTCTDRSKSHRPPEC
ncbi:kell blood group glycoprotein [Trichomycterus rosablanca]|uniref:kell blood group glycoprotein n=1 Tax=Trichomycterus rosablanca TaxID=2290929 RepID=UPI002F3563CA